MPSKCLLFAVFLASAFGYPIQQGCGGCGGCGCCQQIPQEVPVATTVIIPQYESPCCNCCAPQDEPPVIITPPAPACGCECSCGCGCPQIPQQDPITTTTLAPEPSCCNCCNCCLPQNDPPVIPTTLAPEPCGCCCGQPEQNPPVPIIENPNPCCCGGIARDPVNVIPYQYAYNNNYNNYNINKLNNNKFFGPRNLECPANFKRIGGACYYVEMTKMPYQQAATNCLEKGAFLFVPRDINEWGHVISLAPTNFWTWSGIVKKGMNEQPKWQGVMKSMNPEDVNWLIKPFSSIANGWNMVSNCAAYYNAGWDFLNYVYFYPCSMQFYSICEKLSP